VARTRARLGNGYNLQDIAASVNPVAPAQEHRFWYQYYFHTPRRRAGLEQTGARSPACSDNSGRRPGSSMTQLSSAAPRPSTIPILSL